MPTDITTPAPSSAQVADLLSAVTPAEKQLADAAYSLSEQYDVIERIYTTSALPWVQSAGLAASANAHAPQR